MNITKLMTMDILLTDKVVAAVSHEGSIIVVTELGMIFRIDPNQRG